MYRAYLLFVLLFICLYGLKGQQRMELTDSSNLDRKYFIEANLHSGLVINNYVFWDSFPSRTPSALIELNFGKQTIGEKPWQQNYGFPQVGVALVGGYLGNNDELGFMVGLVPNVAINAINENKWSLKIKMGLGFAYFNKPYDVESNVTNILIGSHITNLSIASLYFRRILSESTDLTFGLSALHASDGHYQLPNVGMNMITAHLGLRHYFAKRPSNYYTDDGFLKRSKELKYGIRAGMGMHEFGNELGPVNQSKYTITDLAFYLKKPAGRLGSALAGLGYKYYSSFFDKITEDSTFSSNLHLKASVVTLFLGYEFEMGRMSLLAQGGINVYHPFWRRFTELIEEEWTLYKQIEGLISTRLGVQYYFFEPQKFNKNLYLGLYIKANMGGADFVSLSTGFVF
jgi:hypothetical protein